MSKIKTILLLFSLVLSAPHASADSSVWGDQVGGMPVANFAISAQIAQGGSLLGHVLCNSGRLGGWLDDCGSVNVTVVKDGKEYGLNELEVRKVGGEFPVASNSYRAPGVVLDLCVFCPIVEQNTNETALPVILLGVEAKGELTLRIASDSDAMAIASDAAGCRRVSERCVEVDILGKASFHAAVTHYDEFWNTATRFGDALQTAEYAMSRYGSLRRATARFAAHLPYTGQPELDAYLPYYVLPSLVLTRTTAAGEILTMGYCELNQRDSYWTSWMHLVHFRDAEWKMITESYAAMSDAGKIPTCILPVIERHDDLDINLFLILRTARFHAFYKGRDEVASLWSRMKTVMDWVAGRDFDGSGLPQQVSYWCDWKDTRYMSDRKYSPFVGCLYMAALDQMSKMAAEFGDADAAVRYRSLYDKAYRKMNAPVSEGGLWNGHFYAQIGKDGRAWEHIAQDQMVGVLYGVIPQERAESIMDALNEISMTPYGICNMYPYMEGVEDGPGLYHNGGVWPWMSFMDCWARIRAGRKAEALDIMGKVFRADMTDWVPNEYIDSIHGTNCGFPIQGWNSDLYGLMYFGMNASRRGFLLE